VGKQALDLEGSPKKLRGNKSVTRNQLGNEEPGVLACKRRQKWSSKERSEKEELTRSGE